MALTTSRPRLHYERRGAGETVLCMTGFALSAEVFEPVLDLYASGWDVITYDHRGAGRSAAPVRPASMHELAADAVRLLDELEVDAAHVYGVSFGGMVAQEMAIRYPERVRGLVLGGTSPGGPRAHRPRIGQLARLGGSMLGAARDPGRPLLAPALFSERFRRDHPERVRELLHGFGRYPAPLQGVVAHWASSVYHDTVSRLDRVQAPTLVMHGELDAMSPRANARMLAERIPDAELCLVPRAGHAYPLEAPELSRTLFADWMARHAPIAAGRPPAGRARRLDRVTQPLGLPAGALRTGASLALHAADRVRRGSSRDRPEPDAEAETQREERDVAPD